MDLLADITVVTVAYNSMGVLPRMLDSLPDGVVVVVVDNASKDAPALAELCKSHGATLISNETNRGFGAACNLGAAAANTRFLMFVNPDVIVEPGAFEALLSAAETYPEASAFNPKILDADGKIAFRRRANLRPKREKYRGPVPSDDQEIPVLSGAAFFVEKDRFDQLGGFDEAIFLYHEDDDLAVRLQELGPLMHIRGAEVRHMQGHSTVRSASVAKFKAYHMARSRVYARAKHGLPLPKLSSLWLGLVQLVSPAMLIPRKRAKNWGFFLGALSALKDGGRHDL